jgi:RecA-family ATPase
MMEKSDFIDSIEIMHQEMLKKAEPEKGNFDDLATLRERGWLIKAPPHRKFIFDYKEAFKQSSGFLPEGKACMIASPGGCGKTFLLAHCALAAATGTEWINCKAVKPIKVLFVAAEEEEDELWNRFYNMAKGLGLDRNRSLMDLALDNIIALPQRGKSQRLINDGGEPSKSYLDLKKVIEENTEIKLVILDPAARFMGSETETNNAAATDWVNLIDALTLTGGKPTVLVAHHTNKSALRPLGNDKKPIFDQSMCRGASALVDGFRWVLGLQRSESEDSQRSIFVKLLKSNYSHIGPTLEFEQDFQRGGILKFRREVINDSHFAAKSPKDPKNVFARGDEDDE